MASISVVKPADEDIKKIGVREWPVWEKEISRFDWSYDQKETCYILEGSARVETAGGEVVTFEEGDLVTFPQGLKCVWEITRPIRKHYKFG